MKNFKPILFSIFLISSCASNSSSKVDVLKTTNISEIEEYLLKAHPEDPKRKILQQRIIALKNAAWTKGAKDAKPMEARPIITEMPDLENKSKNNLAQQELFKKLMNETSEEHKEKTKKLLNNMFNEDINHNEAIILLRNRSDCNLVLEISGKNFYNLAVPAKGENFIVVNKDSYMLSSSICDVGYQSSKDIRKSLIIVLDNPSEKTTKEKEVSTTKPKSTTSSKTTTPKGKSTPSKGKKKK